MQPDLVGFGNVETNVESMFDLQDIGKSPPAVISTVSVSDAPLLEAKEKESPKKEEKAGASKGTKLEDVLRQVARYHSKKTKRKLNPLLSSLPLKDVRTLIAKVDALGSENSKAAETAGVTMLTVASRSVPAESRGVALGTGGAISKRPKGVYRLKNREEREFESFSLESEYAEMAADVPNPPVDSSYAFSESNLAEDFAPNTVDSAYFMEQFHAYDPFSCEPVDSEYLITD